MIINKPTQINPQYSINKAERDKIIIQETHKPDDEKGTYIYPYLSVSLCDNLILQNVLLSKCINTFAEDMVYNELSLKDTHIQTETTKFKTIQEFWDLNKEQLCYQVKDYLSYGFGASEVIYNTNHEVAEIAQIPANTLHIQKKKKFNPQINDYQYYYYAVQQVTGKENVIMRLSHMTYLPEDDDLPLCFWLGGSRRSNFFDYPCWIECFNHVSASNTLDLLDAEKINNGNLVSGIITIVRPPPTPMDKDLDETLEEKMENHGSGVFTLELTTLNPDIPLNVNYIKISESNYDYLNELSKKSDIKILANFKMPKARLLIDDATESMNSHKTNTLYKIYTNELNNAQLPLERNIWQFNKKFLEFDYRIQLDTPIFVDDKDIESQIALNLFNNGLITLGQAINKISSIYPEFENAEIDLTNPVYNERYYNGSPLGLTTNNAEEEIYNIGDYIDMEQIEEVFSRQSGN